MALDKAKKNLQQPLKKENSSISAKQQSSHLFSGKAEIIDISESTALQENRVIAGIREEARADIFKILRTKVLQRMRANQWNVIAITSPAPGAGKSLMAANLAVSIAQEGNYQVALVDLDFRRPSVYKYFNLHSKRGVMDHLLDETDIHDLLVYPGIERLRILPAGTPTRASSELLSLPKMDALFADFKASSSNQVIIIDLPPLLHSDDSMIVLQNVDACILIVGEGENTGEEIAKCIELIDDDKYMGAVLNKSTDKKDGSYYYYYY